VAGLSEGEDAPDAPAPAPPDFEVKPVAPEEPVVAAAPDEPVVEVEDLFCVPDEDASAVRALDKVLSSVATVC
jgi:hypothetical protein